MMRLGKTLLARARMVALVRPLKVGFSSSLRRHDLFLPDRGTFHEAPLREFRSTRGGIERSIWYGSKRPRSSFSCARLLQVDGILSHPCVQAYPVVQSSRCQRPCTFSQDSRQCDPKLLT